MNCRSQRFFLLAIHCDYVVGVWARMAIRFADRLALLDERTDEFLTTVAYLGGYCTVDQAQRMGLANSPRRVLVRLEHLERAGFLRRVVLHPLVYQITKSVTRLVGVDMTARRSRPIETARWRLLCLNFYLEASSWPADFIFDGDEKIAALAKIGCPRQALPQRGGRPYLWEEFVLDPHDGTLCVSVVDRTNSSAFLQALGFVKRLADCRLRVGEHLSLVVAVGSEARYRLYAKAARHPKVQKYGQGSGQPVAAYQVTIPVPHIRAVTHESDSHTKNLIEEAMKAMKLTGTILRCLARKVNSGGKETYVTNLLVLDPDNSTGTNYAVEVWDEEPQDLRLMSDIALTVTGVVNKNSGVPAFRAVIAPRPEAEEALAAA